MDMVDFFVYLSRYGLPSLIIGVMVAVIIIVAEIFLSDKLSKKFMGLLPFASGIVIYLAYHLIFVKVEFNAEVISAGLLCGSLGTAVFVFVKNLKNGKCVTDSKLLIISGILYNCVSDSELDKTSIEIANLFNEKEDSELVNSIADIIFNCGEQPLTKEECTLKANLIYKEVKAYKE